MSGPERTAGTSSTSGTVGRRALAGVRGDRAARLAWARLVEPADAEVARLVATVGAEEALHSVGRDTILGARLEARLPELDVDRDLAIARSLGARLVVPQDAEWPTRLDDLAAPPLCLWVLGEGRLDELAERSVAVVGARAATGYGLHVARELGAGLAERRFTVVSGAAYGIDGAAHEGALAVGGPTVAVVAGGVDRAYPAGHAGLLKRIREDGLVMSEVPPGSAPTKWRFLSRNRVIATLTRGTVVVEAGLRSGSRNTARLAEEHHRLVCAVPGPVSSAVSAGCHELIRSGAQLVTDAAEVAESVGQVGELAPRKQGATEPGDDLAPHHRVVLAALPHRAPIAVAELARRTGLSVIEVRGALGALDVAELALQQGEGWRRVKRR
ncbi:DNA protecting protein DprA [Pedococcus dokdonensis]|uniref:DNA protecting protein DprA n=1 Tax=Pedococcus dokdonensis TaxID=443156 RepID=A0A1H0LXI1_9MICO|nr:DNA-processing protein DprA [Pedococcus dokdonensis]SDO72845.1 DNA protecting protein DprA [Pedococcus dokdonensis]